VRADRLAERLGLDAELWIKNDAANPTHSFKDRVVAVAVADGEAEMLAVVPITAAQAQLPVRVSPGGPALEWLPLPYAA